MKHLGEGYVDCQGGCGSWIIVVNIEIRVCCIEIGIFYKRLKGVEKRTVFVYGRRALKAEGTANAKAPREDWEHRAHCGWNRRADGESDREGKEARQVMGSHLRTLKAVLRPFSSN